MVVRPPLHGPQYAFGGRSEFPGECWDSGSHGAQECWGLPGAAQAANRRNIMLETAGEHEGRPCRILGVDRQHLDGTDVEPSLAVGDQLQYWALGRVMDAYRVAVIEPNRFLGLYGYTDLRGRWLDPTQPRPSSYMEALWGFLLKELPGGRTRLVISGYQTFRPRWVERIASWLLILLSWPMQARMMAVLKRNIERAARTGVTTVPDRAAP